MYKKEDYFEAIKLKKGGLRIIDISKNLGIHKDTIRNWLNRGNKPKIFYCEGKKAKKVARIMGRKNTKQYVLPKLNNEHFSYLIGILLSDGTLQKRTFRISATDKEYVESFRNKIYLLFNVKPDIHIKHFAHRKNWKCQYICDFSSLTVRNYLHKLCFRNGIKRVPTQYFKLKDKAALFELVKGFFDGDGTVWSGWRNQDFRYKQYRISAVFQHKELCKDIQRILSLINVKSSTFREGNYYRLNIYGENNVKHYQKLLFDLKRKKFKIL